MCHPGGPRHTKPLQVCMCFFFPFFWEEEPYQLHISKQFSNQAITSNLINTVILVPKSIPTCLLVSHHGPAYTVYPILVVCNQLSFLNRLQSPSCVFTHVFFSAWNPLLTPPAPLLLPHLLSSVPPPPLSGLFPVVSQDSLQLSGLSSRCHESELISLWNMAT